MIAKLDVKMRCGGVATVTYIGEMLPLLYLHADTDFEGVVLQVSEEGVAFGCMF